MGRSAAAAVEEGPAVSVQVEQVFQLGAELGLLRTWLSSYADREYRKSIVGGHCRCTPART